MTMAPVKDKTGKPVPDKQNKGGKTPQAVEPSPLQQLTDYLKGVKSEWHKITWPTPPQIWGQTIVVLVMVSIVTICLFIIDNSFHALIRLITPHLSS